MTEPLIPLLLLGLAAGVLSSMFGIGGGVIIVPVLILLGYTQQQANGTSLAALILPVGLFAVLNYYRAGKLQIRIAIIMAFGLLVGGYFGAEIAFALPAAQLMQLYGVFLLYASWRFADPPLWIAEARGQVPPAPPTVEEEARPHVAWWILLIVGLGAGILSGMFGIGGGIIIVPALITLLHFDQKEAQGTSLGALLMPVSLGALIEYSNQGALNWNAVLPVAIGLLIGALGGSQIALSLSSKTIKRLYAIFLLIISIRFILGG